MGGILKLLVGLSNYWWDESHQYLTLVGQSPSVPPKITPMTLEEKSHQAIFGTYF